MGIIQSLEDRAKRTIFGPLNEMIDDQITDMATTFGTCVLRNIMGKIQRVISFTVGQSYADNWMEEALMGILYEYNNIKNSPRLELHNKTGYTDGSAMYYRLDDGTHSMKYRKWNVLINIQTKSAALASGRSRPVRVFTIICYDLSPEFVKMFERDMLRHKNAILKINKDSPFVSVYSDLHESDGYTYWEKVQSMPKRPLDTIYLPKEQKKKLIETIDGWFMAKEAYHKHGIPWNLKILLYGSYGTGKALPNSTKLPTENGWKRMGDIKEGDHVFTEYGKRTEVLGVYPQGQQDIYVIRFVDGREAYCTLDHLWNVIISRPGHIDKEKTMTTKQLMRAMKPKLFSRKMFSIPGLKNPVLYKPKVTYTDPYVLGVYLMRGHDRDGRMLITTTKYGILKHISNSLQMQFGDEVIGTNKIQDSYYFVTLHRELGSDGRISVTDVFGPDAKYLAKPRNEFSIPKDYLYNSPDVRWDLLRGMMDANGSIDSDGTTRLFHTSKTLLLQTIDLIRSLGYNGIFHPEQYAQPQYVEVDVPNLVKPNLFTLKRSQDDAKIMVSNRLDHDFHKLFIDTISYSHREEATCIYVDNPKSLFVTEQFIVTHNTSITRAIASHWNRNIYECTGGKNGKFIPNAIESNDEMVVDPLFSISDIDKYPALINEPDIDLDKEGAKEEAASMKQTFNNMINALDGILSGEGKMVVMTTNHLEKFSPTILRPGRIDLKMEIGYVTPEVFRLYVKNFFSIDLPENIKLKRKNLTIANFQADIMFYKLSAEEFIDKYCKMP